MLSLVAGIFLLVGSLAGVVSWPLGISGVAFIILGFMSSALPSRPKAGLLNGSRNGRQQA